MAHPATPLAVHGERLPLGIRGNTGYQSLAVDVHPGDRLLLLTDGLPEAAVGGDEPLGYVRLAQLAAAHPTLDALFSAVERETESSRSDDWTAVMIEVG